MRTIPTALLLGASLLCACPEEEPPLEEEVIWEPALTAEGRGELDFGVVERQQIEQRSITGTNNTDRVLEFTVEVGLDAADGFIGSAPAEPVEREPGEAVSYGPRLNATDNTPDDVEGTVAFYWEDNVVTYLVTAQVVDP